MLGGTIGQTQGRRQGLTASNTLVQGPRNASSEYGVYQICIIERQCERYVENLQHDIQPWEYLTQSVCVCVYVLL
jgi:hypothetical protein